MGASTPGRSASRRGPYGALAGIVATMPKTIRDQRDNARQVIAAYCDPKGNYAYRTYDRVTGDGPLTPEDVLMANLLSLRLSWQDVIPLFAEGTGTAAQLRRSLNRALRLLAQVPAFEDHESVDALEETARSLAAANLSATKVSGWTEVTVSKVLHRRRPHIVPIIDSRVRSFYGTRKPAQLRAAFVGGHTRTGIGSRPPHLSFRDLMDKTCHSSVLPTS